jgi:hypothetical protein
MIPHIISVDTGKWSNIFPYEYHLTVSSLNLGNTLKFVVLDVIVISLECLDESHGAHNCQGDFQMKLQYVYETRGWKSATKVFSSPCRRWMNCL